MDKTRRVAALTPSNVALSDGNISAALSTSPNGGCTLPAVIFTRNPLREISNLRLVERRRITSSALSPRSPAALLFLAQKQSLSLLDCFQRTASLFRPGG